MVACKEGLKEDILIPGLEITGPYNIWYIHLGRHIPNNHTFE